MTYTMLQPGVPGTLRKELDQLIESMWRDELSETSLPGGWIPRVDLSETKDQVMVRAEIPGIDPADLKVDYRDGVLTIRGEKKREIEEKSERFYRTERTYGAFARNIRLPVSADPKRISASFRQGVLSVALPKASDAMGTTIPIKSE